MPKRSLATQNTQRKKQRPANTVRVNWSRNGPITTMLMKKKR